MPQETPKRKKADPKAPQATQATLDSIASLYGVRSPLAFGDRIYSEAFGGFNPETNSISVRPGTDRWVVAHEAGHSRDFNNRGAIGQALWKIRSALALPDERGVQRWPMWTKGLETNAEYFAAADKIINAINQVQDVDIAPQALEARLRDTQPRDTRIDPWFEKERLVQQINSQIWHNPAFNGSMIRRAMLAAGYDYQ